MESFEEAAADGECMHAVVKRKRTKRQRLLLHPTATTSSSSSSSGEVSAAGMIITEEEEDMANCLILLARGQAFDAGPKLEAIVEDAANASERLTSRRFAETTTTTNVKAGFYVYECKTCNKCFPSFQALGGHRASHKKPKIGTAPSPLASEKKTVSVMIDEDELRMNSFVKPIILSGNHVIKTKVHECSICGAEFSSGQALGGHMRRHRPLSVPEAQEGKKEQSLLSLDLNLPAPSDDEQGEFPRTASEAFAFVEKRPPLLFSASALVGCHY